LGEGEGFGGAQIGKLAQQLGVLGGEGIAAGTQGFDGGEGGRGGELALA
jgi:hypothetical protein